MHRRYRRSPHPTMPLVSPRRAATRPAATRPAAARAAAGRGAVAVLLAVVASSTACLQATSSTTTGMGAGAMTSTSAGATLPPNVTRLEVERGKAAFNAGACMRCHGALGIGGDNGPSLVQGPWLQHSGSYDQIVATITNGVPASAIKNPRHTRAMRARGGPMELTDAQVREVAAYVWSISRDKK